MIITTNITMDLSRQGPTQVISAVQDDRYSRNIAMTLTCGGVAWEPPEGVTAVIRYRKPDGTGGNYDTLPDGAAAWSIDGSTLTVALAPQVCTVPGRVALTAALVQGETQLHTFVVGIDVQPNPGLQATSENYYKIAGALPDSGWEPNAILATNSDGKVIARRDLIDVIVAEVLAKLQGEADDDDPWETLYANALTYEETKVGNPVKYYTDVWNDDEPPAVMFYEGETIRFTADGVSKIYTVKLDEYGEAYFGNRYLSYDTIDGEGDTGDDFCFTVLVESYGFQYLSFARNPGTYQIKIERKKTPIAYLYDGVELKPMPDEIMVHPYRFVVSITDSNNAVSYYAIGCAEKPHTWVDTETYGEPLYYGTDGVVQMRQAVGNNKSWVMYPETEGAVKFAIGSSGSGESDAIYGNHTVVWTNHDIFYPDGRLLKAASTPTPVYE